MRVLSVCDGIGLLLDALDRAGIEVEAYHAIEIDPKAREMADWRHGARIERPRHDLLDFTPEMAAQGKYDLIAGGIPCTTRSLARQDNTGADRVAEGTSSGLIHHFAKLVKAMDGVKFMVENVPSAKAADAIYNDLLGVKPVQMDAGLVCAQQRKRLFWMNWAAVPPLFHENRNQVFGDIQLPDDHPEVLAQKRYEFYPNLGKASGHLSPRRVGVLKISKHMSYQDRVYSGKHKIGARSTGGGGRHGLVAVKADGQGTRVTSRHHKTLAIVSPKNADKIQSVDGNAVARLPTVTETERLFTLHDGATAMPGASRSLRQKCLGNGWVVDIVAHILREMP